MFSKKEKQTIPVNNEHETIDVGVPHPGQTIFQLSNALRYFNTETILRQELKDDFELCLKIKNITLAFEIILNKYTSYIVDNSTENGPSPSECSDSKVTGNTAKVDLVLLFWLMSILPETYDIKCKQIMDRDQYAWKISLYDVIIIFLNWGASLKSLKLEDINSSCSNIFSPRLPSLCSSEPRSKDLLPSCSNVRLVLTAISERLPGKSQMPDRHRVLLIKLLMSAMLDNHQRSNMLYYYRTLCSILDSFQYWDNGKAIALVRDLELTHILPQNSIFVFCCVFNMMSERMLQVGILACYNVIHDQFDIPVEPSFPALVDKLPNSLTLFKKYKLKQLYMLVQLVHSLFVKHRQTDPHFSKVIVEKLNDWTEDVHSVVKIHPYSYNIMVVKICERTNRLITECVKIIRSYQKGFFS